MFHVAVVLSAILIMLIFVRQSIGEGGVFLNAVPQVTTRILPAILWVRCDASVVRPEMSRLVRSIIPAELLFPWSWLALAYLHRLRSFDIFKLWRRETVQALPLLLLRLFVSVLISAGCHSSTLLLSCEWDFSNEGPGLWCWRRRGRIPPAHLPQLAGRQPVAWAKFPTSPTDPFSECNWLLMRKSILVRSGPLSALQSCQNH